MFSWSFIYLRETHINECIPCACTFQLSYELKYEILQMIEAQDHYVSNYVSIGPGIFPESNLKQFQRFARRDSLLVCTGFQQDEGGTFCWWNSRSDVSVFTFICQTSRCLRTLLNTTRCRIWSFYSGAVVIQTEIKSFRKTMPEMKISGKIFLQGTSILYHKQS